MKNKWGYKLTDKQLNERIWQIESCYPKHQHIDLDKDLYNPLDRSLLIRYYRLRHRRKQLQLAL